ncbi:helix-turn-helix transcriptional regulator [Sphingomonas flavalba]|uniref:helix-turn-helix transcriptional regulator n=1 Tax=Sphingomonas flavalba TaxID=2559804 RepID=UPI0039E13BCF
MNAPADRARRDACNARSFALLGGVIGSVGTNAFYQSLGEFASEYLDSKRWMLMRYRKFARPEIIVNRAISRQTATIYLDGLYRLDPILQMVTRGTPPPVTSFRELRSQGEHDASYDGLYRRSFVEDELIVFSPDLGGAYLVLTLGYRDASFTPGDLHHAGLLRDIVVPLHRLHIERSLARDIDTPREDNPTRKAVCDVDGRVLHRSANWDFPESDVVDQIMAEVSGGGGPAAPVRIGDYILHWDQIAADHPLAPNGRVFLLESRSPGYVQGDIEGSLASFAETNNLTPREHELIRLTIRGYPTSGIAQKLNLTVGTVKSYKHRLYEKLDITTEREVLWQFIAHLFGDEPAA